VHSVNVKFEPDNVRGQVAAGSTVAEAASHLAVPIAQPCGALGQCGKCQCVVRAARVEETGDQRAVLGDSLYDRGVRLACQTRLLSDAEIEILPVARVGEQRILVDASTDLAAVEPDVRLSKTYLELDPPTLTDQRADLDRIVDALAAEGVRVEVTEAPRMVRGLAHLCRASQYRVTAVAADGGLVAVEPGDTRAHAYAVAVDIGTTTVVAYLADLRSGHRRAVASAVNPQVAYGDDVVSRIRYLQDHEDGIVTLQGAVVSTVDGLIGELVTEAGIDDAWIYRVVVVGNATMTHLLWGADPSAIAQAPYIPTYRMSLGGRAADVGLCRAPCARLLSLPGIAGWIGADTTGVILSARLHEATEPFVAVDIGTNGEIVLGRDGRLLACSAAAGPAFEGAQIFQGMRAAPGAVDTVDLAGAEIRYTTIGGSPARGICGSGLFDAMAALRRAGVVNEAGTMLRPEAAEPHGLAPELAARLTMVDDQPAFVLVPDAETALDGPVVLTQRDVRRSSLAKGAIAAGIQIGLCELGMEPDQVARVVLAGAFGSYVRPQSAADIGLFPPELVSRTTSVGNAAGAGAFVAAVSDQRRHEADAIAASVEYLELATRLDFSEAFAEAMVFPSL